MDLKNVKPLDLDDVLGKAKNRVALVGVELEGGWKELPKGVHTVERDSSVFNDRAPAGVVAIGELPIGPAVPAAIPTLMRRNYPHKINSTCGMHVHVSFETLFHYGILMVPEFQETVFKYLTLWAKDQKNTKGDPLFKSDHYIWERLSGENKYCKKEFWPDAQVTVKRKEFTRNAGHRYTAIHYCGRYNTIECRILPMMNTPAHGVSAVMYFIDVVNACLHVLGKDREQLRKGTVSAKVELDNGIVYEEEIVDKF